MRVEINLPSCWDGKNAFSADQSHVAYPPGKLKSFSILVQYTKVFETGGKDAYECSDKKYPYKIPRVFIEVLVSTDEFDPKLALNPKQPWTLSNGDVTGFSYHFDYMFGWKKGSLDQVPAKCACTGKNSQLIRDSISSMELTRASTGGSTKCCSLFTSGSTDCHVTPSIDEPVYGTLPALPGTNPIPNAPNPATTAVPVTYLSPVLQYAGNSSPAGSCQLSGGAGTLASYNGYTSIGCVVDSISSRTLGNTLRPAKFTLQGCIDACKAAGYKYCATSYSNECYGGPTAKTLAGSNNCNMPCKDNSAQICGGAGALSMYSLGSAGSSTCKRSTTPPVAKKARRHAKKMA